MQKFERPGRETRPTSSPTQSACSCSSARAEANFGVKTTAPSRLYWAERPAMRVVQALHWLHDAGGDTDPAVAKRLRSIFADPDHGAAIVDDLAADLLTLPFWMQQILRETLPGEDRKSTRLNSSH